MDPITFMLLLFTLLVGGGSAAGMKRRHTKQRRRHMRNAIMKKRDFDGMHLSLFDLYWDLGVSDFALEIMAAQSLVLKDPDDLEGVLEVLHDRIKAYGDYEAFVDDMLDAIQEFYQEHRRAGHRRQLPNLEVRKNKTLPMPAIGAENPPLLEDQRDQPRGLVFDSESLESDSEGLDFDSQADLEAQIEAELDAEFQADDRHVNHDPRFRDPFYDELGHLIDTTHRERRRLREERSFHDTGALQHQREVDIDALVALDVTRMIKSLLGGRLAQSLHNWLEMRDLRSLRDELNDALGRLYHFYQRQVEDDPSFYNYIYDTAQRWREEQDRIRALADQQPWEKTPHALCADMLTDEARILARHLSLSARNNVDDTIKSIHTHARKKNFAMAGYLLYLNHHAFFPHHDSTYLRLIRHIEFAAHRVQRELGTLHAKHVI